MSQRYKREIEEILKQAGELSPPEMIRRPRRKFRSLIWLYVSQSLGGKNWSISPGRVMFAAVSLLLAALIFRAMIPGVVAPLAWAGLLMFIVGYGMFFIKPPQIEKRWRGQPLEEVGNSWWDRIRKRRN